jgi:hypothetical protein
MFSAQVAQKFLRQKSDLGIAAGNEHRYYRYHYQRP